MGKILLVEDDRLLGKEVSLALGEAGFDITWAHSAEEAYTVLAEGGFSLAFLDIMLENKEDGFAILSHIKGDEKLKDITAIMLTNISPSADIDRAMELGAKDYVIKAMTDLDRIVEIAKKYVAPAAA